MIKHSSVLGVITLFALACTGPMGPRGHTGPPGPAGMTGAQGPIGATGTKGQSGVTASPDAAGTGWVSLRDILFDYDDADIRASEMNKLSEVVAYVNQHPSVLVGIDGSTDLQRGTNVYNVDLSQRRVANVRDALVRAGISANRIETGPFGVERVACNDSLESCSRRDGRVEVMARSN